MLTELEKGRTNDVYPTGQNSGHLFGIVSNPLVIQGSTKGIAGLKQTRAAVIAQCEDIIVGPN